MDYPSGRGVSFMIITVVHMSKMLVISQVRHLFGICANVCLANRVPSLWDSLLCFAFGVLVALYEWAATVERARFRKGQASLVKTIVMSCLLVSASMIILRSTTRLPCSLAVVFFVAGRERFGTLCSALSERC